MTTHLDALEHLSQVGKARGEDFACIISVSHLDMLLAVVREAKALTRFGIVALDFAKWSALNDTLAAIDATADGTGGEKP